METSGFTSHPVCGIVSWQLERTKTETQNINQEPRTVCSARKGFGRVTVSYQKSEGLVPARPLAISRSVDQQFNFPWLPTVPSIQWNQRTNPPAPPSSSDCSKDQVTASVSRSCVLPYFKNTFSNDPIPSQPQATSSHFTTPCHMRKCRTPAKLDTRHEALEAGQAGNVIAGDRISQLPALCLRAVKNGWSPICTIRVSGL